jgi:nucleoside diphosphate kinase
MRPPPGYPWVPSQRHLSPADRRSALPRRFDRIALPAPAAATARPIHPPRDGADPARRRMSMLSRAALYAGRNLFGSRAGAALAYAGAAAAAAAAGVQTGRADKNERSFIMIKPDGVNRGLVSEIIGRFERRGYKLVAIRLLRPSEDLAKAHYHDLKDRPFFPRLTKYLSSAPVVAMVWEGEDIVKQGRAMIGATSPLASAPGTFFRPPARAPPWRRAVRHLLTCLTPACPSTPRHDPRRLVDRRREQHHPRLGHDGERKGGNRPVVWKGGRDRVGEVHGQVDLLG